MGEAAENFEVWFPCEVLKGASGAGPMRLQGIISSETLDADGEVVLQDGLDFSYFLKRGWVNDNHDQSTGGGVGVPVKIDRVTLPNGKAATRMEAELFDTPEARRIYGLAKASSSLRPLGWSIEGTIERRLGPDKKIVAKAKVRDCSITRHPKNPDATVESLAKSLTAARKGMTAGYNTPDLGQIGNALVPQDHTDARPRTLSKGDAIDRICKALGCDPATAGRIYDLIVNAKKRRIQ